MMRKLILLILFIVLTNPTTAIARFSYSYEPVLRAEQIAIQFWSSPLYCSYPIPVKYTDPIAANLVDAGPEQKALERKEVEISAWATPNDPTCTIYLNKNIWIPGIQEIFEFHHLCNAITHEIGHFLGYTDINQNPKSIKFPLATEQNYNSVPGCIKHNFPKSILKELEIELLIEQKEKSYF